MRWENFEYLHRSVPQGEEFQAEFHTWFLTEKADIITKCMLPGIRKKAGLGENPDHFFTNMCESKNKTLKCCTDYKEHELRSFIEKIYTFVQSQENLRKAVIRNDHWRFCQEYQHLEVDADKWFTLSEKTQQTHIRKMLTESLGSVQQSIEVVEKPEEEDGQKLSPNYECLINTAVIPTNSLRISGKKHQHSPLLLDW